MSTPERLAPNSPEAEAATLGSILVHPEMLFEVSSFLQPDDFFIVKNAKVYEAILQLSANRQDIDNLTVIELLSTMHNGTVGYWIEVIGSAYITELTNNGGDYLHVETYARIVERAAIRRRLLKAAGEIAQCALEENAEITDVIDHAETMLYGVTERHNPDVVESAGEIASRYYDQVEALYKDDTKLLGYSTGFHDLDRLTSGLSKGRLYILGAVTGVGKTSFTLQLAMNGARAGVRALFVSLEMERDELINRLVGSYMNLDTQKLERGELDGLEWGRFTSGLADLKQWPLFIDDSADMNITQLRSLIRRWVHRAGVQVVYVDYLQLMNAPRKDNREQQISYLARSLKLLAKEFHIPIVVCAQLNRDLEKRENKRPQLSDLRESGAIAQHANVVMFLYRDEMYHENTEQPNQCDVIVGKNRHGPTGVISLYFRKEYTQFANLTKPHHLDLTEGYGKPTPQKWPTPAPRRRAAPVHLPDDEDRNGDNDE